MDFMNEPVYTEKRALKNLSVASPGNHKDHSE